MEITEINLYPLKSARGLSPSRWDLDQFGLVDDRRWMVVNCEGQFITGRRHPLLTTIDVALTEQGIELQRVGMPSLEVKLPDAGAKLLEVVVWGDQVQAQDAGDEAAAWLESVLENPCRLVYMPAGTRRQVDTEYAQPGVVTSFADGFPLLLIGQASLDDLNARLDKPVPMRRFRPNLVVSTKTAFEEDQWQEIRVGDLSFSVVKSCSRCILTTVDPQTGIKGKEPLQTLSTYRRQKGGVMFGQNLVHKETGTLTVGDEVTVVS
ncbi:MOSC domain-containing protein [Aestuariirhabdus sp. Z084]|uniref:MOSC domain-containing protein n=1 Tax=Aestuariirhabdus haliotis TaxID=2918751 RepID=UPI00201B3D17|nr:MOSC domain-containing protein [Aestuariirhabdus haliotis]MCL6414743.1 MOSC domain-containing protein [Aestuariirhabdus haliotis]MCL6418675.1 MOSC domain-containing protein [Aestuariirhabdus haliotis]